MTDLTKFIQGEVQDWDGNTVTLLHEGELDSDYVTELEREIYGDLLTGRGSDRYTDEAIATFKKWAADHGVHFYADCKENFFIHKGASQAVKAGKKYLLAENLS